MDLPILGIGERPPCGSEGEGGSLEYIRGDFVSLGHGQGNVGRSLLGLLVGRDVQDIEEELAPYAVDEWPNGGVCREEYIMLRRA